MRKDRDRDRVAMWDSCDESECSELTSIRTIDFVKPEMFEPTEQGKVSGPFFRIRSSGEVLPKDDAPVQKKLDHTVVIADEMTFSECIRPHASYRVFHAKFNDRGIIAGISETMAFD